MDKYSLFYHASQNINLAILEPRSEKKPHDFTHGPVVWATPNLAFATEFIVNCDDSLTKGGSFGETCYLVIGDKEKYLSLDRGGSVYVLPANTFHYYKGHEWYSLISVVPIRKIIYSSGLQAMLDNGVQVYFPDRDTFSLLKSGEDHLTIVRQLKSENEKLNINFIKL